MARKRALLIISMISTTHWNTKQTFSSQGLSVSQCLINYQTTHAAVILETINLEVQVTRTKWFHGIWKMLNNTSAGKISCRYCCSEFCYHIFNITTHALKPRSMEDNCLSCTVCSCLFFTSKGIQIPLGMRSNQSCLWRSLESSVLLSTSHSRWEPRASSSLLLIYRKGECWSEVIC